MPAYRLEIAQSGQAACNGEFLRVERYESGSDALAVGDDVAPCTQGKMDALVGVEDEGLEAMPSIYTDSFAHKARNHARVPRSRKVLSVLVHG